jgi:hypothetical protein
LKPTSPRTRPIFSHHGYSRNAMSCCCPKVQSESNRIRRERERGAAAMFCRLLHLSHVALTCRFLSEPSRSPLPRRRARAHKNHLGDFFLPFLPVLVHCSAPANKRQRHLAFGGSRRPFAPQVTLHFISAACVCVGYLVFKGEKKCAC